MKKNIFLFFIFILFSGFAEEKLNLRECIRIAIENNLKLKAVQNKIEVAYYQKEIAQKYKLPTLSTSFNYTYLGDNEGVIFNGFPPMKFTEDNIFVLKFTINYPLYTGGKIEKSYQIAKENYEKSKIDFENEIANLIFDVEKAYYNILKIKKFLETGLKYKENLEKHLSDAKKLFNEGLVTKLDILKTEVALKNAETRIIETENYLKIAKSNLNFILNRPLEYEFEIEDILEKLEEKKDYNWWKETALRERGEIKSMEKLISIYRKNIDIEKSNLYPQIFIFLNYNIEKGSQTSISNWDTNWNAGFLFSFNIWDWGQTKDKIKKAEKEKEEIEKQFDLIKNSIEIEVKNAYLNFLSAESKIEENKKQIELAEENLRIANLLYNQGLATNTDVIDAITMLTEAKNNYYSFLYEYKMSYIQLLKASGLLKWEEK
ncbi:MAG: TolC family protein [bacterium]|nr:TolC family protein [bacterium]MDW8163992.1 TolC family protein [Candidatus Omnitrophota bacterium]